MSSDNTSDGLSVLAACTAEVRQWYLHNGLQFNPDKSEALIILALLISCVPPTQPSHRHASPMFSYRWPTRSKCSVSCWMLDRRLAFDKHVMAVTRSCNFHAQALRHIRHLLSTDLAQTLACSLILTRLVYCNSVLYGAPVSSIQKLQRVQNNAARIVLQAPRRSHANRRCVNYTGCMAYLEGAATPPPIEEIFCSI